MAEARDFDAVIVGAGPNGLSAAIHLAQNGRSVLVLEARDKVGGGARSAELTLPAFIHDVCSAIHPLGAASPFFQGLPLGEFGLSWIDSPAPLAHPFDDGSAAVLERSVEDTSTSLGTDSRAYRRVFGPLTERWTDLADQIFGPFKFPRHPFFLARFGLMALRSATSFARTSFRTEKARALFAGCAAHSILPLTKPASASFGLALGASAHAVGWPIPRGGSQQIADSLAAYLVALGGVIETGHPVESIRELDGAEAVLFDTTPRQLVALAGERLTRSYRRRLERFKYGAGVFKLDLALDGPIPWKAQDCARAATVHVGGSLAEITMSESAPAEGKHSAQPFVLVAQQSLFDDSRAPADKHTVWAYCHVPNGSTFDMTDRIEAQIERFAPGFRDRIIGRSTLDCAALEDYNANYIGGDISGGAHSGLQILARPVVSANPYRTSDPRIFLCSSSTPPGAGVHGMCGFHAARAVLRSTR